jgi:DNA repair exonuclease SbcCD ATPase subunit
MNGPRFLGIDLRFGRHSGRFDLPPAGPVVITGPNGSGKSTLVDALFRTVHGFRKQKPGDRELLDSRRPWTGGGCDACVEVELPDGTVLEWSRDFDTDFVTVRRTDGTVLYEGEAKPGGRGSKAEDYADIVTSVFGLDDLEDFKRTSWIAQGTLRDTGFDAGLLTLVEGGHASVESALLNISEAHKELTKEPISGTGRALSKNRLLENQLAELASCRTSLAEARSRELARGPAIERLSSLDSEEADLAQRIEVLDQAHGSLLELEAATAQTDLARRQLDAVVELRHAMERAADEVTAASGELSVRLGLGEYPSDFGIRASRLKEAWDQLGRTGPAAPVAPANPAFALWAAGGLVGLGAALEIIGQAAGRFAILAGVVIGLGTLVIAHRRRTLSDTHEAQKAILIREIRAILDGVPDPDTVTAETLPDRLESFERQESSRRLLDDAQARLEDVERRAGQLAVSAGTPDRSLALLESDAERALAACESRVREVEAVIPDSLPDGVERVPADVKQAVDRHRLRASDLSDERRRLEVQLAGSAQITGVEALEEECSTLGSQIEETRRTVSAHRAAHALIQGGYAEFREQDEARLIEAVAARLRDLGGPVFGGFRAADGLEDPTVAMGVHDVGLESSQLSHGQRLVVKLAVRIGTADFLAVGGTATPLVVDDPFAHLDDENSARVWSLLSRLAETRQVIVTTQETELLDRLGVTEGIVRLGDAES